jgi:hypothetical protein
MLALTSGCGGGGGSGSSNPPPPPPPPPNASPGGIWEGTSSLGETVVGLVTETGDFHFLQSDGVQYFGTVDTSQNALSADFQGVTQFGTVFLDGSTTGTGTLTGTVQERGSMSGTSDFTTAFGSNIDSTITLTYNALYERDSSLAIIAGNYRDPATNAIINVNSNGVIFSQDAVTGCVINGTVEVIDSRFNAYLVQYIFSGCMGLSATLNDTVANGLGTLDNTVSPEQAIIGVVNVVAGYALTGVFPRT